MLQITIPETEFFNAKTNEFYTAKEVTLCLEHSLVSLSKWESKWKKPFLSKEEKTKEETIDYIRCMTITQNIQPDVFSRLTLKNIQEGQNYIDDPMTATWFSDNSKKPGKRNNEAITAELIYYWMITYGVPFECQKWHLNRLLTLIKVCDVKNAPAQKMSSSERFKQQRDLNARRKAALKTRG